MNPVDEVRDRLDILAVVGDYVQLKKAGRLYKGVCPFHSERTPSFVVYPDSGNWRCFGACATGGDAFSFVMRIENLDFRGALDLLARRVGVDLAPPSPAAQVHQAERDRLRDVVAAAADFYHGLLMRSPAGEPGREYLRTRELRSEVAKAFKLGYAPDAWSALVDTLLATGFTGDELVAAGLARLRDTGGYFDAFRHRLIIPISDPRGRPVGFGARIIDPAGTPKYLNSPQSELFDKGHLLYGLHRAGRAIRETGQAVVVEGYTDVIRAHSAGFENVVASMGTALTEHQLTALKRYTSVIILALDADAAGQSATLRGLEVARDASGAGQVVPVPTAGGLVRYEHRMDLELRVAILPAGQDPDDVVRTDPERWREVIASARPVMKHLFDVLVQGLDLREARDKTLAADRLLPVIEQVPDPVARAAWLAQLAEMIRIDERTLAARMKPVGRQLRGGGVGAGGRGGRGGGEVRGGRVSGEDRSVRASDRSIGGGTGGSGGDLQRVGRDAVAEPVESATEALSESGATGVPTGIQPGFDDTLITSMPPMGAATPEVLLETVPANARAGPPDLNRSERVLTAVVPSGDPAADVLGLLLADPRRFLELNQALHRDGQTALGPQDFERVADRHLIEAVRYAGHGAPPPDLPPEERLDALPSWLAEYVQVVVARASREKFPNEQVRVQALRTRVLRLRIRMRRQMLPGLRMLLADAAAGERADYDQRVRQLSAELGALERLVEPEGQGRDAGKMDKAFGR